MGTQPLITKRYHVFNLSFRAPNNIEGKLHYYVINFATEHD